MFECKKRKLPDAVLRLPVENGHRDEVLDSFILSALALSAAGGRHTFIVHLAVFEADCDKLRHAGYMRRKHWQQHSSFGWTKNRWEPSLDFLSSLAVLSAAFQQSASWNQWAFWSSCNGAFHMFHQVLGWSSCLRSPPDRHTSTPGRIVSSESLCHFVVLDTLTRMY